MNLARPGSKARKLGFQIALLLAVVLLPLTLISMAFAYQASVEAQARNEAALTGETMLAASNVLRMVQEARGTAAALSETIQTILPVDDACSAMLAALRAAHPMYSQISFVPPDGLVRCSSTGRQYDISQGAIFRAINGAQGPVFTVSTNGTISRASVLALTHPVFDDNGDYLGYVVLSLPHDKLGVTDGAGDREPLDLLTFNRDGTILAATGGIDKAQSSLPKNRSLQSLVQDEPTAFSATSVSGQERVFSLVPLVPGELFALGTWPATVSTGANAALLTVPFLGPALIWVASLAAAWMAVEWLVIRHIRRLNKHVKAFTEGDRRVRRLDVSNAPAEIAEMAAGFDRMTYAVMRDEAELEDIVHQKDVLLREVNHRVKNNLQMIASIMNMQMRKSRTPVIRDMIRGLQGRVMSLAAIHRGLYETKGGGDVHAGELLDAIARQTMTVSADPDRQFDLRLQLEEDVLLTPDQAVPLALLAGEALMAAMAQARAGPTEIVPLHLQLTRSGPTGAVLDVEVTTDSIAVSLGEVAEADDTGFSTQLISVLASQIGGTLQTDVVPGRFLLRITFRIQPPAELEAGDTSPETARA